MVILLALTLAASPPKYHLALDLPATAAAGVGWLVLDRSAPALTRTSCPCDRASVPAFDRFAIDSHFAHGGQLANATLALSLAGDALALAVSNEDIDGALVDVNIAAEAAAVAGLATEVAKIAFARPYPYMFRAGITPSQQAGGINYASMWSGHSAVAMAAAIATARLLGFHRDLPRGFRIAAWIAGPLLAVAAGVLEVTQANHFPSDVAIGSAAGAAIGWGVVQLHAP